MLIHCITFGSYDYTKQVERIKDEALQSGFFDTVTTTYPHNLDVSFRNKHKNFLHGRGYGYWIWKPQIILQKLSLMVENDILCYVDSGCTINKHGKVRFLDYINFVSNNKSGIVCFQLNPFLEKQYTKKEVFEAIGYEFSETLQICATYFFIRKCKESMQLVREWSELTQNYTMINDEKTIEQDTFFIDHRHDQSIWSILNKKYKTHVIPEDEGWPPGRREYPIWGSRIRKNNESPYKELINK